METRTTPWKAPKPNPIAFASAGALQKKQRPLSDRQSLPVFTTPETPSKKEKSKFVLPINLSPFALSPQHLVASGRVPQITISKTKLSNSFHAEYSIADEASNDNYSDVQRTGYNNLTRSSSPVAHMRDSRGDNIFGASSLMLMMEDDLNVKEDTGSGDLCSMIDDNEHIGEIQDPFSSSYNANSELWIHKPHYQTNSLPWKSIVPVFFSADYFDQNEWIELETHKSPHISPKIQNVSFLPVASNSAAAATFPISTADYFEMNYEIIDLIGSGSFSNVYRVINKNDSMIYALKRSRHSFSGIVDRQRRLYEVMNMWLVSECPNCVQIINSWEQFGFLYIVMELCDHGSLRDVITFMAQSESRFTEYQIWQILHQLASGLRHIHSAEIVHLDIKPANILINVHGILKIGDFGLSMQIGTSHDPDAEGDKYYMAPETLEGQYGKPADIFSLGLLILELATNVELPSQGLSWQNLRHGDYSELNFDEISNPLCEIIRDMMNPDPSKRPEINEIIHIVENQSENK